MLGKHGSLAAALALLLLAIPLIWKLYVLATTGFELGNEGDEGTRILSSALLADTSWGNIFYYVLEHSAAIHPPGDVALRAAFLKIVFFLFPDIEPVRAAMYLSLITTLAGAILFLATAYVAGGVSAALVLSALLFASWNFHNVSLSGMGEASMIPFFAAQIYLLALAIMRQSPRLFLLSAATCCLATLFRPEPFFFVPGICLAIWRLQGFLTALAYGVIATSFQVIRTAFAYFLLPDEMNMLNFNSFYPFKGVVAGKFFATGFGQALLNDPLPYGLLILLPFALFALRGLIVAETMRKRSNAEIVAFALSAGLIGYLLVTVTSVVTGRTANATIRLAFLPTYMLMLVAALSLPGIIRRLATRLPAIGETSRVFLGSQARTLGTAAVALVVVALATVAETRSIKKLAHARAPADALALRDWLLANTSPREGLAIDFLQNRENWMVAYLSRRPEFCAYFHCWSLKSQSIKGMRTLPYYYQRTHTYIATNKPRWIAVATGALSKSRLDFWRRRLDAEQTLVAWSMIYPYSRLNAAASPPLGASQKTDTSIGPRTLTILDNFEVELTPAFSTANFVVYSASYRR